MIMKPVRFEEKSLDRLDKLAAIEDRDASYLIRAAVDAMLDAHEWQVQDSLDTLQKIDSGEMELVSHEDVKKRFQAKRTKN
ncbi:CopG family ribbon-helix-helix protein [Endozoicomonas arenosclerae]|uniref:CopG family ribbon-helix-helix protein n=1 Tax=Endozoicomonas arenosclerae TaxID=1633495 RepID=UPI00129476D2|nr:CopG family transcriptional regulator [Endozoicomonas arenosclerae]